MDTMALFEAGDQVAWDSLPNQKPIVMLNVEADVTVGVLLPVDKGQIRSYVRQEAAVRRTEAVESKKGSQ